VVLPVASVAGVELLLSGYWGKDAIACVFSRLELPLLLARLRLAARGQSHVSETPAAEHMLGSCRPSQLSRVLTAGAPQFVGSVLAGVEAFLIEPQTSPQWEILADESFVDILELLGLSDRGASLAG
jgi:hypothetical protein